MLLLALPELLAERGLKITGVLHLGAHRCEELDLYRRLGVSDENIVWVEANPQLAAEQPHVHNVLIGEVDDQLLPFHVASDTECSSLCEFGTHRESYPEVEETATLKLRTVTVDTFLARKELTQLPLNLVTIHLQGAELQALRGMPQLLTSVSALYMKVATVEIYRGCVLLPALDLYLEARGFQRVVTALTFENWGDALYLRTSPVSTQ